MSAELIEKAGAERSDIIAYTGSRHKDTDVLAYVRVHDKPHPFEIWRIDETTGKVTKRFGIKNSHPTRHDVQSALDKADTK